MPLLTQSKRFKIEADHERAYVHAPDLGEVLVGEMYGNPQHALITHDERHAVLIGHGVMVVRLELLAHRPGYRAFTRQQMLTGEVLKNLVRLQHIPVFHLCIGSESESLWFEMVYQPFDREDHSVIRLVADVWSEEAGIYDLSLDTLQMQRIFPRDEDTDLLIL